MPFTLTMPKLSPTMEEGTIAKWHAKEGQLVKAGDLLFEVATDKATVEHSALDEGWLRKILVKDGESAQVNQAVAIFTEKANESIDGYTPEGISKAKPAPAAPVEKIAEKPTAPQAAPAAPAAGAMQQPSFVPEAPLPNYTFEGPTGVVEGHQPISPLARRLAKEKGVDLSTVKGTGPHGRIVSRDLELGQPAGAVTFGRREVPQVAPGTFEEEALTPMRKAIAKRLQESKTFIPHFYVRQEVSADALMQLREQLKAGGLKISVNDLVVRAAALSLREHPAINSGFNSTTSNIIRFKTIDISIAVSLPLGLITPIVRHADYKNLGQISSEVKQLADKARHGKLAREEYMGGSFTISNLGMYGVSDFAAIINPPQAAILAVSAAEEKAVVCDGKIVPGKTMMLTLSVDHRVIDGSDAAKFIKTIQKFMENPALLLL
ncbi:MAG: pyruvate dehydrogenase complex dihydrolipoamide acetyltransferase [Chlamydiales bacterium]|nr:pyruvate dehydrogenase complex dihydrolipoamide acetyltransferase [Chlamydiales bacterium]